MIDKKLDGNTGLPSVEKPWLKLYSDKVISFSLSGESMYELIQKNNIDTLSAVALRYYGTTITYKTLFDKIEKAASAFRSLGIKKGDIVTIMSMQTPETIISLYGLNYIGAVANLVYASLSESELVEVIIRTDSKMLLILDVVIDKAKHIEELTMCKVVVLGVSDSFPLLLKVAKKRKKNSNKYMDFNAFLNRAKEKPALVSDAEAFAVMVYTSGTTGTPKGVMLSNKNLNAVAQQCNYGGKNYHKGETTFFYLPPFTGYGIAMLHLGLVYGIDFKIHLGLDVDIIIKKFIKSKSNRVAGGPAFANALIQYKSRDLSYLIDFTGGGESVSLEKEDSINDYLLERNSGTKYTTGYGMTEFASVVCMNTNQIYKRGSLGIPLPKVNVKIVDSYSGAELSYMEVGEMCFSAPNMMIAYYKNEHSTSDVIEVDKEGTRWLHTGDLGYVDKEGFVFFVGRKKRIYLTCDKNGAMVKIFPQRIEECIAKSDYVNLCGVVVVPDKKQINVPFAFVTVRNNADISDLRKRVKEELPEHLVPKKIIVLESMPITSNGKIDYVALSGMIEK